MKMRKAVIQLKRPPSIISCAAVGGAKEKEGPIGEYFDIHDSTDTFGQSTWERSESEMQRIALNTALSKCTLHDCELDAVFAGDLINQCTSSSYGLIDFDIPFFGLYGACSTAAEGLVLASALTSSGVIQRAAVVTSSHNCSSERQFRYPLEYGGQRPPTAQWTVTGSGAFIVSSEGEGPYITEVMPGRTVDKGITDANNMGAAMAPAAIDTLSRYFRESGTDPSCFDGIFTGDLGYEGYSIVLELMKKQGYDLEGVYSDCGLMIYNRQIQDMHAGGSGCGCSACVLAAYLMDRLRSGALSDILFIGTGALMSPMSVQQGQSIPGVAHLVRIKTKIGEEGKK